MAPNPSSKKGTKKPGSSAAPTKKLGVSKVSKSRGKAPPAKQQKTKSKVAGEDRKKKKRVYTDEELGIPKLNMVTPVGVQKPRGKKKGKVFVDDAETMQTILALVNAEKEGEIESKMMRARQMEEIREARQKEAEAKEFARKQALEGKKDQLRKKRSRGKEDIPLGDIHSKEPRKKPKKVSFG